MMFDNLDVLEAFSTYDSIFNLDISGCNPISQGPSVFLVLNWKITQSWYYLSE